MKSHRAFSLALLGAGVLNATPADAQSGGVRASITPAADHHVHLLGPYALPVEAAPPVAQPPPELNRLLVERAQLYGQDVTLDRLEGVYAERAQLLDDYIDERWMREKEDFVRYFSLFKSYRTRVMPEAYQLDGSAGFVSGTFVSAVSGRPIMNFLFGLRKGSDGRWRIASESVTRKKPPAFLVPITADRLIASMDKGAIRKALVLSEAFWIGGVGGEKVRRLTAAKDKVTAVQLENDWAAGQVARYPDRLALACGLNPLEDYAIAEALRCKTALKARALKMNLGSGGDNINLHDQGQVAGLRRFFKAANDMGMPMVVHLGSAGAYGAEEVGIFLKEVVAAAPDIPIQIAHMSSGFQSPEALTAFADARASGDPLARNLYFDLSIGSFKGLAPATGKFVADSIRKIGLENVLYASDELPGDHHAPTAQHWDELRLNLPLTDQELSAVADNVAPYLRD